MLLPLPSWPMNTSIHYLDCCIEIFTKELENAHEEHSSPVISIYAYLRGCALLARGYLLEGLEDLYLIENVNLFPKDYIQTIILPLLSDASLFERFLQQSFYLTAPTWKKIKDESDGNKRASIVSNDVTIYPTNMTRGDLSFDQFYDYVNQSNIVFDRETAVLLFKALLNWIHRPTSTVKPARRWSLGGNTYKESSPSTANTVPKGAPNNSILPGKIFEQFLEVWQRTSAEKARMNSCLPKHRQKQETILMVNLTLVLVELCHLHLDVIVGYNLEKYRTWKINLNTTRTVRSSRRSWISVSHCRILKNRSSRSLSTQSYLRCFETSCANLCISFPTIGQSFFFFVRYRC